MNKGKAVGVISIKGGVGKTTSVINLAHTLSNDFGKKVLVIDANFSSPNVALHLGNMNARNSLNDLLSGKAKANEVVQKHQFGFDVIAGAAGGSSSNYMKLKEKIQPLKSNYDVILLDSSPTLNEELLATMTAADELYVVSTPDLPTLSTTIRAVKLAKERKTNISGMILNKTRGKNYELKPHDMERLSGVPLVGVIKDNVRVLEALSKVKPMTMINPHSSVSLAYKQIASHMVGMPFKQTSWHHKALGYLKDDFTNLSTHKFTKGLSYYK